MEKWRKALVAGDPVLPGLDGSLGQWVLFLLPLFLFTFSLVMLYNGMRGVMELGGFVASGGPYEIAHPAPGYVWVFPVFINVMVISMIASPTLGKKVNGPNLMSLSWSALFISLGWNFTEFGFRTGSIAWIICAVLFMAMGLIPLAVIIRHYASEARGNQGYPNSFSITTKVFLQLAVVGTAVLLALSLFRRIS